jgi:hypothetical protein
VKSHISPSLPRLYRSRAILDAQVSNLQCRRLPVGAALEWLRLRIGNLRYAESIPERRYGEF